MKQRFLNQKLGKRARYRAELQMAKRQSSKPSAHASNHRNRESLRK
jgi:hypothetical protein